MSGTNIAYGATRDRTVTTSRMLEEGRRRRREGKEGRRGGRGQREEREEERSGAREAGGRGRGRGRGRGNGRGRAFVVRDIGILKRKKGRRVSALRRLWRLILAMHWHCSRKRSASWGGHEQVTARKAIETWGTPALVLGKSLGSLRKSGGSRVRSPGRELEERRAARQDTDCKKLARLRLSVKKLGRASPS
eukprot:2886387-Rhodomonas_salina.1